MTDPTLPGPHLDLEALAELEQGIAPEPQATAMSRHLAGCAECTDRLTRVRTTRALLSALPADPIPPAVAERIASTLEQAASARPAGVLPLRGRRPWWRSPAIAGSAAAAGVAVLVAAVVAGTVLSRKHHDSAGTNAPAASAAGRAPAASAAALKEWQTGSDYSPATLPALVPRLITGTPGTGQALSKDAASAPAAANPAPTTPATVSGLPVVTIAQMRASSAAVVACGHILADDATTTPLAVDFARFLGRPAVVVVLPTAGDASSLDVWVVRSVCSAQAADPYFRRIHRPA